MTTEPRVVGETVANEIRRRVETELLVRRLLESADDGHGKERGTLRHPAFLVILTFGLTGVLGSSLTSCWQAQQWRREQTLEAARHVTKERVAVMNMATQAIAESFTAAEDVLHLFAWEWSTDSPVVNLKERSAIWTASSRRWRVEEKVLLARIEANFDSTRAPILFTAVMARRRRLGNDIQNLLALADQIAATGKATPEQMAEIEEHRLGAQRLINETTGTNGWLGRLIAVMVREIQVGAGHG